MFTPSGLIDGYTGERAELEAQVRHKEELRQQLEQELQVTGSRLQELEHERQHMQQERELLSRQQDAMRDEAGPRELRTYPIITLRPHNARPLVVAAVVMATDSGWGGASSK